jgi:regulator of replication initiation timing
MSMLDDRIAELEDENAALQRENAALRAALDNIRTKISEAAKGDCRTLHDFERIALAIKEAQP